MKEVRSVLERSLDDVVSLHAKTSNLLDYILYFPKVERYPDLPDGDSADEEMVAARLKLLRSAKIEVGSLQKQDRGWSLFLPRIVFRESPNFGLTSEPSKSVSDASENVFHQISSRIQAIRQESGSHNLSYPSKHASASVDSRASEFNEDSLVQVKVLFVESPDNIFVRETHHEEEFLKMRDTLERDVQAENSHMEIQINSRVVCRSEMRRWERGLVMRKDEDCFRVRLMDIGKIERIDKVDVRPMGKELEGFGHFTLCVSLANIEPAGASGTWSRESTRSVRDLTQQHVVLMRRIEGETKLSELFVEKIVIDGPMRPSRKKIVSVSRHLQKEGLALDKGIREALLVTFCQEAPSQDEEEETEDIQKQPQPELKMITPQSLNSLSDGCLSIEKDKKEFYEKLRLSLFLRTPEEEINLRLSAEPDVPTVKVFRAKLTNIDTHGTVWVAPIEASQTSGELMKLLKRSIIPYSSFLKTGEVVVMNRMCRGRITSVEDDKITMLDIDTGRRVTGSLAVTTHPADSLADIPPRAIPLKLYGVMKSKEIEEDFEDLLNVEVMVSNLSVSHQKFPLTAVVRTSQYKDDTFYGNLALDLLERGSFKMIKNLTEWLREQADHGLDSPLDPRVKFVTERRGCADYWSRVTSTPDPLSLLNMTSLPHPLPLAAGQWLSVMVEGLMMNLVDGREEDPTVEDRNASQVWCNPLPIPIEEVQEDNSATARAINPQLESLRMEFNNFHEDLQLQSSQAEIVDNFHVGQNVLAFYRDDFGAEWSRASISQRLPDGDLMVFFTDYGHSGACSPDKIRVLTKEQQFEPINVKDLHFKMPEKTSRLEEVRSVLLAQRLLVRVEEINSDSEGETVVVSFWQMENGVAKKIC